MEAVSLEGLGRSGGAASPLDRSAFEGTSVPTPTAVSSLGLPTGCSVPVKVLEYGVDPSSSV